MSKVIVVIGAGSIGQAIARRASAGKKEFQNGHH
jgi:predicted dinucleotide-binding enzyme